MGFLLRPFTNAESGSLGELLEVLIFCYCFFSLFAPIFWYAWRGIDDPNRLRRYLTLLTVPFVWSIMVAVWAARRLALYVDRDFSRELREMLPRRKPVPALRSPRDAGLYD